MYRGTDDLHKFFAIGTSTLGSTRAGNTSAPAMVANMQLSTVETERGEEVAPRMPNLTATPPTVTTEASESTTTTTNVSPTASVGSGGASGPISTKPAPIATTTKMQEKKMGMTTTHWIILAVVVVSLFAAYKYFKAEKKA